MTGVQTCALPIFVNSGGQVGIGTNSPIERLDVYQNTVATGYQEVTSFRVPNNAGSTTYTRLYVTQYTTNQMQLETADNNNVKGTTTIQGYGGNVALIGGLSATGNPGNVMIGGVAYGLARLGVQTAVQGVSPIPALILTDGNQFQRFHVNSTSGNYNPLVQAGDLTLIYSNFPQNTGNFVIAPWNSISASGIRMSANGNVMFNTATVASGGNVTMVVAGFSTNAGGTQWAGGTSGGGNIYGINGGGLALGTYKIGRAHV